MVQGTGGHEDISIHALREEGDQYNNVLVESAENISIHALREEGDPMSTALYGTTV